MDLAIEVERAVQHFPRSHKYALGAELRALCHQGLGLIAEANSSPVAGRSYQGGTKGGEGVALAVDNSASRSRSRSLDEAKRNPGALLKEGGGLQVRGCWRFLSSCVAWKRG